MKLFPPYLNLSNSLPPAVATDRMMVTIIEPQSGALSLGLPELWRYRDLLLLLVWRDVSARYRQSVVGYGWAIVKPLATALIYTLVFSLFVRIKTDVPYVLFAFTALIPWLYFSGTLAAVTGSVVGGGSLLTKVYFPRMVLPLAAVAVGLVELVIQLLVVALMMVYYQHLPGWHLLFLPVFILIAIGTALAIGTWLTAINVKYRDIGMAVPFLLQIWMYLCPIVYPVTLVPDGWMRRLYALNPMVGVVEGFRWSLLGSTPPDWSMLAIGFIATALLLISGIVYFRKTEATFADII